MQPPTPGYGYFWTPGYWAWDPGFQDYYWVPGTWVLPPRIGLLWTPGYWAFNDGVYLFHAGYWGPTVGFYGGVNYGFGYGGFGYEGGYWRGRDFFYNARVNNFGNQRFANVFDRPVSAPRAFGRASFNGGAGGVQARPTSQEQAALRERHIAATPDQARQAQVARLEPSLRASVNHGAPSIAATARPAEFRGPGAVAAAHAARAPINGAYRAPNREAASRPAEPRAGYAPREEYAAGSPRGELALPSEARPPAFAPRPERGPGGPPRGQTRPEQKPRPEGGPEHGDRGDHPQ